jgi:structural maintenance of chromosome 3 (chondroitin sulfate proteoglycan 6)
MSLQLDEHLRKRQAELRELVDALDEESIAASGGICGDAIQQLQDARARLATAAEALGAAAKERAVKRDLERSLQASAEELKGRVAVGRAQQVEEAKALDRLLARRAHLQLKAEEFSACIRKLGALPKDALEGSRALQSSKILMTEIDRCHKDLSKLGRVNKKALDQYAAFSEERERLLAKQEEMEAAREAIEELIAHLDHKKEDAVERTYKGVSLQFSDTFEELVPGGSGKLVMRQHAEIPDSATAAARVANYAGVGIKVQFPGQSVASSMAQLSGGQKTMVALCLVFAIQRCDPAPFYIFDEIDAALDATHRASLAAMIERQSAEVDSEGGKQQQTQFITTTFRPELIRAAAKCFGVTHARKASNIKPIEQAEAQRIIAENQNRQRQHIGTAT